MSEVTREEQTSRDAVAAGEGEQREREARLRAMQSDLLRARERAESVQAEVTKAKVSAAALAERREGLARSVQRMQEQRSEEEARTIGERRGKAELAVQGTRLELTHLEQQVRERHLMELAEVAVARREAALQLEVSRAEEQMHSLREKIDALGEVSLTAIDEAREVGERFAFLSS